MSYRRKLSSDVFKTSIKRITEIYQSGNRVIAALSGGKDSGVVVELARIAAKITGAGPVEVFMLDDEIMYPGTFEYCDYIAALPDIKMHWCVAGEPMPAVWNRNMPYWWIFDDRLDPDQWVRKPPAGYEKTGSLDLYDMVNPYTYPPPKGKDLCILIGNRAEESRARMMSIHAAKSFLTHKTKLGHVKAFPIYDWTTSDIWKAVYDNHWIYNRAYDTLTRMGVKAKEQRIAPPTMTWFGMRGLQIAARAWPKWYDKVNERVPGAKAIANFGMRAVMPLRKSGESWKECFYRECVDNAPEWIKTRAIMAMDHMTQLHTAHSQAEFPEVANCGVCGVNGTGCWKGLAELMYTGDPYSLKANFLPYVQPCEFRPEDTRKWKFDPAGFR